MSHRGHIIQNLSKQQNNSFGQYLVSSCFFCHLFFLSEVGWCGKELLADRKWKFGQIYLEIRTNAVCNYAKYSLQFKEIQFAFGQINFVIYSPWWRRWVGGAKSGWQIEAGRGGEGRRPESRTLDTSLATLQLNHHQREHRQGCIDMYQYIPTLPSTTIPAPIPWSSTWDTSTGRCETSTRIWQLHHDAIKSSFHQVFIRDIFRLTGVTVTILIFKKNFSLLACVDQ